MIKNYMCERGSRWHATPYKELTQRQQETVALLDAAASEDGYAAIASLGERHRYYDGSIDYFIYAGKL